MKYLKTFCKYSINLAKVGLSVGIFVGAAVSPAFADPEVPQPPEKPPLPTVFCFRFTDIKQSTGDPQNNRFEFEFESLNWSNQPASGIDLSFNKGTGFGEVIKKQTPSLVDASVDKNGRAIGEDYTPPLGNQVKTNDWSVATRNSNPNKPSQKTGVLWSGGTPISKIDLLAIQMTVPFVSQGGTTQHIINQVNALYPSFNPDFNPVADPETIDNGPNVLDGFVFTLDNFDVGKVVSFNWLLLKEDKTPIGSPGSGNPFGFGTINLTRINPGDPLPGPVLGGNTGFSQSSTLFYNDIFKIKDEHGNVVAEFAGEFGVSQIAPFKFVNDNRFQLKPDTYIMPEPLTILGASTALGFGTFFKRKLSNKGNNNR
ncbi:hypothetical protein AsFPU1_4165 [Aphanothece sacrum FPU1]|uniref:PEP-CTERM sorting domain-containing protein n=1 Tax=Aphanothece sacrum FPU1 TaxID=1920663 RepID=A0A401INB1_APHSA|nr:hypothetical protein AsFPU1_4165 [Aphanothece sacrum FPU1]GBF84478.1 hypothetical protein AsFPU3_1527 [Aphanothece sacrum FPU3]